MTMAQDEVFRKGHAPLSSDIDELNHVSNIAYVRWVQDMALDHSAALGWDFAAYRKLGAVFVVRRHEIEYLQQAFEGEALTLTTWVSSWRGASSWRQTRIQRGDQLIVRASTLWALIDRDTSRPRRIPAELKAIFTALDHDPTL
jgi:acyl-CoA thioester hydrolase